MAISERSINTTGVRMGGTVDELIETKQNNLAANQDNKDCAKQHEPSGELN